MTEDAGERVARDRIERFVQRFGEPYRRLAWYAALPLVLTPDLLHYLRVQFLRRRDGVPWIAEADLLLSELCRPVGYEQYALDQDVRAQLVGEIREREGPESMRQAARLLLRYIRHLGRAGAGLGPAELQAERWSAMAYLEEQRGEAVRQIATAFAAGLSFASPDTRPGSISAVELARLVRLTDELASNLSDHRQLLAYAGEIARLLRDPTALQALGHRLSEFGPAAPVRDVEGVLVPDLNARTEPSSGRPKVGDQELPNEPRPFRDPFKDGKGQGPSMLWLPGGTFRMGDGQGIGEERERPAHDVTLRHFALGKYPLTVGEFRRFVEATDYETDAERGDGAWVWNRGDAGKKEDASWRKPYMEQDDRHPVVCISWNDAKAYCDWLGQEAGQTYGLLTEAQWEYACRAGSETAWCFGDDEKGLEAYAWFGDSSASGSTHPVGGKRPNAWQLYDMHGDVWEGCEDWYAEDYYRQPTSAAPDNTGVGERAAGSSAQSTNGRGRTASENPSGPESGAARVVRGGSWSSGADRCRSACRDGNVPGFRYVYLGFRLSRTGPLDSYPFTLGPREQKGPPPGIRDRLRDGTEGPPMVWLRGGTFRMGQDDSPYDREKPVHPVQVSAFSVGQSLLTFAEYDRYCEAEGKQTPDDGGWGRVDRPVINISWEDAQSYCAWLSKQTGEQYRLLTEAEWEYACRAGGTTQYCYGDDEQKLGEYAWYGENAKGKTHPVGEKKPNDWHIHDMHGNLWEWCADWFGETYYQELVGNTAERASNAAADASGTPVDASSNASGASRDPSGPESGSDRVMRGGSWYNDAGDCRSAYRDWSVPGYRDDNLGFRLSRTGPWRHYPFTLGSAEWAPEPAQDVAPEPDSPTPWLRDNLADESEGPDMVWLPGGTFLMGDERGYDNEKPVHAVRLATFSVGQYPVTCEEYGRFCAATGRERPEDHGWGRGRRPVVGVSFEDAQGYCKWLSEQTRASYELLTEAQWEYACRAGREIRYCLGDDEGQLGECAWYGEDLGKGSTHPVGEKRPNAWSLYDMHGNVWEWVKDCYAGDYYAQLAAATRGAMSGVERAASGSEQGASENPAGPKAGSYRVMRGGSWFSVADYCRSAYRRWRTPSSRGSNLGFRLSRNNPWPSYALTLARQRAQTHAEAPQPQPEPTLGFEPYQGFRDTLADGGEAPELVYLPGGTFLMGDANGPIEEKPVHLVRLDAFAIGRTPVTVGEYLRFCEATGGRWPAWLQQGNEYHIKTGSNDYYRKRGVSREAVDLPIVGVAWDDAKTYCAWLSEQTGEVYGLLTEAQWEYACRAGSETRYWFGSDLKRLAEYAWYSASSGGKPHAPGAMKQNKWGLYDMHGNVWEWVNDLYSRRYYRQLAEAARSEVSVAEQVTSEWDQPASENPTGPESGSRRVVRGGSWDSDASGCRSAFRGRFAPNIRYGSLGFRVSRSAGKLGGKQGKTKKGGRPYTPRNS